MHTVKMDLFQIRLFKCILYIINVGVHNIPLMPDASSHCHTISLIHHKQDVDLLFSHFFKSILHFM